jgi:hypothetical protein
MANPEKEHSLWKKLSDTHQDLTADSPFGLVGWGSLEWAGFLSEVFDLLPEEKRDQAIQKIFLETDFEKISFKELLKIIYELERNP